MKVYAGTNIVAINIASSGVFGSCGVSDDGDSTTSKFPSEVRINDANLDRKYSKSLWIKEPGFGISTVEPPVPENFLSKKLNEFPDISSTDDWVVDAPVTSSTLGRKS